MNVAVNLLGLIGWVACGYTVVFVDPGDPFAPLWFYFSLFVALTCTLARVLEIPGYEDADGVRVAATPGLGHASVLTILLLFALWLQSLRMLTQLNGILLFLTFALIELGFRLTGRRRRSQPKRRPRRSTSPETPSARETLQ